MTVKELIQKLNSYPQNAHVAVGTGNSEALKLLPEEIDHWDFLTLIDDDGGEDDTEYDDGVVLIGKH